MFNTVLFPTDFSDYAEKTAECINDITGIKKLIVFHALESTNPTVKAWLSGTTILSPIKVAEKKIKAHRKHISLPDLHIQEKIEIIEHGSVPSAILDCALQEHVSLIVLGARGRGIITGLLLGSVSERVLRSARNHVLVMKFGSIGKELQRFDGNIFSKILCPIDFSKPSLNVLEFVRELEPLKELILLHVIRSAETQEELQNLIEQAEVRLTDLRAAFRRERRNVKISLEVDFGNPADMIARYAERENVTMIVLSRLGERDYRKNTLLGSTTADVAKHATRPVLVHLPAVTLSTIVRELAKDEFHLAEAIWFHYHGQKADPDNDRIFGVFVEESLTAVARCKRHHDGLEVDGVFVPVEYRNRGYARMAVELLVRQCGEEALYMHSTLKLVDFYRTFGFQEIDEDELPASIRERFNFAQGDLEGTNVRPMMRLPKKT